MLTKLILLFWATYALIGKIPLGKHSYYERQVAQGADDYYSGRGEAPGEWTGAGAQALGLSGEVSAAQSTP